MRGPVVLGIGVLFAGYTFVYYGYTLVRGPGVGLLDLLVPGRFGGFPAAFGVGAGPGAGGDPGPGDSNVRGFLGPGADELPGPSFGDLFG